jgi:hypothetical protein
MTSLLELSSSAAPDTEADMSTIWCGPRREGGPFGHVERIRSRAITALIVGTAFFHLPERSLAGERVEYEGELSPDIPGSTPLDPPPLIRVVTVNGKVLQISFRDRRGRSDRTEVLAFNGNAVTRYRIVSAKTGRQIANYDLARDKSLSQRDRERALGLADLLLRHFHQKGGYRRLKSS